MTTRADSNPKSTRWSVWVLAAFTLVAAAIALVLAWQNADLENELKALQHESPVPMVSNVQPPNNDRRTQDRVTTTSAVPETSQASAIQPVPFLDALKASEEAARNERSANSAVYPFEPRKQ